MHKPSPEGTHKRGYVVQAQYMFIVHDGLYAFTQGTGETRLNNAHLTNQIPMRSHLAVYQRVPIMYGFQMFHVGAFYSTRLVYKVNMPATQKRSHCVRAHPGVIHFCSRVEIAEPYALAGLDCHLYCAMPPVILIFICLRAAEPMLLSLLKDGREKAKFFRHVIVGITVRWRPRQVSDRAVGVT